MTAPYRTPPEVGPRPGPGGTSGGMAEFAVGILLMIAGGYLFLDSVHVTSHWGGLFGFGRGSFGLSLLPLLAGIAFLFFNARSAIGWLLTAGGAVIIFVGVLSRMDIYFARKSLFETLLMLGMLAGGIGLIARSLRAH